MKHQVIFVFSPGHYDELDSEWDTAFEASVRLKEIINAGFSGSYIKKVEGLIPGKTTVQLDANLLIVITVNGTPLETNIKFKNRWEAENYLRDHMVMYRGVAYEIRVTKRYKSISSKVLPIHVLNPEKSKFFNEIREEETTGDENYCGGY